MKLYTADDANTLNKNFYNELLHILGLEEVKTGGKKLIKRKSKNDRDVGSMIENTILKLRTECDVPDSDEALFEIALELNIIWLNRILFLKLLEARLSNIHDGKFPKFMAYDITDEFDKLNTLFFEVLSKKMDERDSLRITEYKNVPYLNSTLFEPSELEKKYLRISNLKDNLSLKKYKKSVLKDEREELNTLEYLLKFLSAYDFGSDEADEYKSEHSLLINSAVLGLIFEKINGYKEGSFFTPSFITSYMTRKSLEKVVVDKFNERFGWNCKTLTDVYNKDYDLHEANEIVNSITICDPAVGSAHFLVSALNELIAIKSELDILMHEDGKRLQHIKITVENDELYIEDDGEIFEYKLKENYKIADDKFRLQKTIFDEKRRIIENQLFGVDINPNSVQIARLRLWIELLKDSYYDGNHELVTLPNIDINIQCGNSLNARFDVRNQELSNSIREQLKIYKDLVREYKLANDKSTKAKINDSIRSLRNTITDYFLKQTEEYDRVDKLLAEYRAIVSFEELSELENDLTLWALHTKHKATGSLIRTDQKEKDKLLKKIHKAYEQYKNIAEAYKNSFEWRFMFPEALDDEGEFVGFDIVIANPPYLSNKEIPDTDKKVYIEIYGISDDLYNYFFTKGFEIAKRGGLLSYITSNTFMTINSKINVRKLLQSKRLIEFMPIKNPFEEAAVKPIIVIAKNNEVKEDYEFDYVDIRNEDFDPTKNRFRAKVSIFRNAPNRVFFTPNEMNMAIYDRYIPTVRELLDAHWDKISTSKNIAKHRKELELYRQSLKPGDITLLGLVTDGGQGLATGNNGKYIGVKEGTKEATRVRETRSQKLTEFNKKHNTDYSIENLSEFEIRELFDSLKERYGRDVFGQGYIYRIVSDDEIADVASLSQEEKTDGIEGSRTFVPYDKGDRDGNKWYYETPFYIDWSRENVKFLKENSGKKGKGMPVVRNPQFYFKEGFSWNNVLNPQSKYIKCRLKGASINDVASMSLYPMYDNISAKYVTVILNSYLMFHYLREIVNNTVNLQINDFRQFPIVVPRYEQLKKFEAVFDRAKDIKIKEFSSQITKEEADRELDVIQKEVDDMVMDLYGLQNFLSQS